MVIRHTFIKGGIDNQHPFPFTVLNFSSHISASLRTCMNIVLDTIMQLLHFLCRFLGKLYVGIDSSGTIYIAFQDPGQIVNFPDCSGDSGNLESLFGPVSTDKRKGETWIVAMKMEKLGPNLVFMSMQCKLCGHNSVYLRTLSNI